MDGEVGSAEISSAEEDSSEEESSSETDDKEKNVEHRESSSSSSASSSSSEEEEQGEQGEGREEERVVGHEGAEVRDEEEEERVTSHEGADSQFPNTQQLFGGESSGSESSSDEKSGNESPSLSYSPTTLSPKNVRQVKEPKDSPTENGQSRTVEGLFGDTAELSSSEDEHMSTGGQEGEADHFEEDRLATRREADMEQEEEEVPRINVEIPRCVANLGADIHFVKLPNFLSVETRPFDADLYEDEGDEDEILDEEGRARLKLKVENTIRWRFSQDESGNEIRESNSRLVQWSDGSMSLYLGSEIFDIYRQPLQGEFSHLFVRQGTGLQGQAVFRSKLTFRPHSTDSQTHRKMTLSIADRFSKAQKIRVLPAVGKDPESQRLERIKREEENLKAAIRRDHHRRRLREKHLQRGGLSASYLEPDRELESEEDISAIKSNVQSRLTKRQGRSDTSASESEGEGTERLLKAKEEYQEATKKLPRRSRKLALSDDEDDDSSN